MIYLWMMDVCWREIINIIYRGRNRFIASSSTPLLFFCWTLSRRFSSLLFSQWRESNQTWISSAIDCLPYNSSFYPGRRVHRWIWISTMKPATFYHLAAVTLRRIFISSSVSSLLFFSFDLFSRTRKLIQRMIVPILFPCVNVTGPLAIPLAISLCLLRYDISIRCAAWDCALERELAKAYI